MNKTLMVLICTIFILITIKGAIALSCVYDPEPILSDSILFNDKIYFICNSSMINYTCLNYLTFEDKLIQSNPDIIFIEGIGIEDKFKSFNRMISLYYSEDKSLIRAGINYSVNIICSNNSFIEYANFSIIPSYMPLDWSVYKLVWLKDNAAYIIFGFLILIILIILIKAVGVLLT